MGKFITPEMFTDKDMTEIMDRHRQAMCLGSAYYVGRAVSFQGGVSIAGAGDFYTEINNVELRQYGNSVLIHSLKGINQVNNRIYYIHHVFQVLG